MKRNGKIGAPKNLRKCRKCSCLVRVGRKAKEVFILLVFRRSHGMELDQEMFYIAGMDKVLIEVAFFFDRLWTEKVYKFISSQYFSPRETGEFINFETFSQNHQELSINPFIYASKILILHLFSTSECTSSSSRFAQTTLTKFMTHEVLSFFCLITSAYN